MAVLSFTCLFELINYIDNKEGGDTLASFFMAVHIIQAFVIIHIFLILQSLPITIIDL
jgi:hypothetical protein